MYIRESELSLFSPMCYVISGLAMLRVDTAGDRGGKQRGLIVLALLCTVLANVVKIFIL